MHDLGPQANQRVIKHIQLQRIDPTTLEKCPLVTQHLSIFGDGRQMFGPSTECSTVHESTSLLGFSPHDSTVFRTKHHRAQDLKPGLEFIDILVIHLKLPLTFRPAPDQLSLTQGGFHSRIDSRARALAHLCGAGNLYVNRNMIGAVVGVQPFGGRGLSGTGPKAGGPHYVQRFGTEFTLSNNISAVGGNASLLTLGSD